LSEQGIPETYGLRIGYSEWSAARMTPDAPRMLLVRHGETAWSRDRRHTGRTDIPLTPLGEVQAAALAPRLAGHPVTQVLVSPLVRARHTADLAGLEDPEPTADLLEWDYGDYEGRTTAAIREDHPGWDLFADGVPGGETIHQVATRVDRVIARARAGTGDTVCVAHAHLLRVLAVRWLDVDPRSARFLVLGPASLSILGWEREQPVIERWNT
jgi:probable phosphoglycerate mutase